jgi:hypothetical protein
MSVADLNVALLDAIVNVKEGSKTVVNLLGAAAEAESLMMSLKYMLEIEETYQFANGFVVGKNKEERDASLMTLTTATRDRYMQQQRAYTIAKAKLEQGRTILETERDTLAALRTLAALAGAKT